MLKIYTDGSCHYATRVGSWAVCVVEDRDGVEKEILRTSGSLLDTTNNQMELGGFLEGLNIANDALCRGYDKPIVIYSDSEYCVKGFNEWLDGWQKRGWKTAAGKKVKNQDYWKDILMFRYIKVKVEWLRGHAGHKYNEVVDQLATEARKEILKELNEEEAVNE